LSTSVCGESVQPVGLRTFADEETRLPCEFKVQDESKVVQVTWSREQQDGVKEQIITNHMTEGIQEFPGFVGRVRFESLDPFKDSALLILSTKESDDATYTCHISTFPSGNFEKQIRLTVWRIPIAMLEPVILEEGQTFRVAATCRAVGLPRPELSWDTDLLGQTQNKSSEDKVISSTFLLHPLRSLNGRKLDCLVWHPALENPQRLSNTLVVHFPPNPEVVGYDQNWSVGRIGAGLRCESGGNPRPQNFTWNRKGKSLPEGVTVEGNRLFFTRPLNKTDEGVYECEAKNSMGAVRAEFNVDIPGKLEASFNNLLIIIVGGATGGLVVLMVIIIILVNRHHRRRNRKLKRELTERKDQSPPPLSISSGPQREGGMEKEGWGQREGVTEGEEGDCTSNSYQISEALSNHFQYSNGFLRPKPHPNAILLHPRGQII
uniref:Ig-like domain-containing protein n=1 Tax=Pygocentrus nattereri TaxID=42514 RepID=A0AAR2LE74_PYGNA